MNKSQMNTISGGMRSFIIICIASVCLSISAANAPRNNVEIILQVEPSLACVPQEVYLHALIESESEILDSAQIDNNHRTIRLSGVVPYQTNVILTFSKTNLDAEVVVTPGDRIWLTLGEEDADYYHCVKDAKGSKAHSEYVQFMNYIKNYNIRKARYQDTQLITKLDSISRESISDILRKQQQQYIDYMLKTSKSKYPFLVWYANVLLRKLLPQKEARNLLNNAISRFPAYLPFNQLRPGYVAPEESRKSKVITEKIWRIQTKRMKIKPNTSTIVKAPQIGEELPMLLHREDGRMTSLLVFRGKYVLVEFWASWCQPCLKEIPNIVKAKQEFGDSFEVCAITLDKISSPWKRAINEKQFGEGIHHYQCFDKHGNQYKDIASLGVETIPQNYLLDGEGRIIAINIYGEDLIRKLEELTKK